MAFQLIKNICEAFLANIFYISKVSLGVIDVHVVKEFLDVFLYELLGLPPYKEVDFKIEIVQGAVPISIAPY